MTEEKKMEKMHAMVLTKTDKIETNPLQFTTVNKPTINKENELLVEIKACGICRSNLHLIEGDWNKYGFPSQLPIIPGHEIVGIVKSIGNKVRKIKIGDRVGIQPLYESCLMCEYCIKGRENLCNSIKITDENLNGGYAEYISIWEDFVTIIPDKLDFEHAAPLFCPGITAYNAVKATEPTLAKSVGIFGAGEVGHLAIQFAKLHGSRVIAISRSKNHLDIAKRLGADSVFTYNDYYHIAHTLHNDGNKINNNNNTANHNVSSLLKIKEKSETSQESFIANLKNEEGEKLLDSAIVFAPSEEVIGTAIKSVKKGGIIIIGVAGSIPYFSFAEEKIIKGSVIGSRKDMVDVIGIARDYSLEVIVDTFPLEDANKVLSKLKVSDIRSRAVLLPHN
jgi:alcohol dehydrogenase, propanol-preferring